MTSSIRLRTRESLTFLPVPDVTPHPSLLLHMRLVVWTHSTSVSSPEPLVFLYERIFLIEIRKTCGIRCVIEQTALSICYPASSTDA